MCAGREKIGREITDAIKESLRHIAISRRVGVEEGGLTYEEIDKIIVEYGDEVMKKYREIDGDAFMFEMLSEIARVLERRGK